MKPGATGFMLERTNNEAECMPELARAERSVVCEDERELCPLNGYVG